MNPLSVHANALPSLAVLVSETEKPVPLSPMWFCLYMFSPCPLSFLLIFMCQYSLVGNIWPSTSICFLSCSKTERPPSLSLFPGGDGMVRGGLGGARMVSSDVWHSSDLGRPVYAPGYQVWQIWLLPKRQGRSHDNHHSVRHSPLKPACVEIRFMGGHQQASKGPWFWPSVLCLALWRLCLILAIWNEQLCLKQDGFNKLNLPPAEHA